MVQKKTWQEFRDTGLLLFINSILHAFGWAIVISKDKDTGAITESFPARVKFRGFSESDVEESHRKIGEYLLDNSEELYKDSR